MKKYTLYVGADNQTGIVNREGLESLLNSRFDGYTIIDGKGYWHGKAESMACVIIFCEEDTKTMEVYVQMFAQALKQDTIGLEYDGDIRFILS